MKGRIIFFLFLSNCAFLSAQKPAQKPNEPTPLTTTQIHSTNMTAEELLGLPSTYTVLKCQIYISSKEHGGLFKVFYAKTGSPYCLNANASNFAKLWQEQVSSMASKGTIIGIEEIIVQKGDKEMKWMPKSFIVP